MICRVSEFVMQTDDENLYSWTVGQSLAAISTLKTGGGAGSDCVTFVTVDHLH